MKPTIFLALTLAIAAPIYAQQTLPAPPGWTQRDRDAGAHLYTPGDLKPGEVFSVTVYDSTPLEGKTLQEWLVTFGGPVAAKPGALKAPLTVKASDGQYVTGAGVYGGPNNTELGALFFGISLDGAQNIHAARILFSSEAVLKRYDAAQSTFVKALSARARTEAGSNFVVVPSAVKSKITPGGELVPGVYAGNQYSGGELRYRFRIYIYPNGEYRVTNEKDEDQWNDYSSQGTLEYNRQSGQLELSRSFDLNNDSDGDTYCYYGRDAGGKPTIIAAELILGRTATLVYDGPPTKREAPGAAKARLDAAEAEARRFKWTTPPGKGVADAQIAAILNDYDLQVYSAGLSGMGTNVTDDAYLLLKDGTVYAGLPVPPDQLDITRSRQKEPEKWGKWTQKGAKKIVSWNGKPYVNLPGDKVLPAPPQTRLSGRYGAGSSSANLLGASYELWGVTFDKNGRFKKDGHGGSSYGVNMPGATQIFTQNDDNGSVVSATGSDFVLNSQTKKNNPNGDREGTYSISGYVITLRYDNGMVTRTPFFFVDGARKTISFEGNRMSLDEKK